MRSKRTRRKFEAAQVARLHAEDVRKLLEQAKPEQATCPMAEWLAVYGREIDDVRATLDWALSPGGDAAIGVALTIAAEPLWFGLSLMDE
jgi:predicted ATPase